MRSILEVIGTVLPGERVSTRPADLDAAARDESSLPPCRPDVVAWPLSTEEVAAVVAVAYAAGLPVTARGAGSSLEGNPIPVHGGIVLDLSRMNRVLALRPDDLQVDVEPGVVYAELNRQLRPHGLFFPPSPGGSADVATIGGMVANNASGIYSARYGGTRDHVRAATAVTGTGSVIRLGSRCRKESSGYNLLGLVTGSEGTLAVLTSITLALAGLPAANRRWSFAFQEDRAAAAAIADLFRYGVDLAAAEFLDRATVEAVNRLRGLKLTALPTLLLEAHGSEVVLREADPLVESIAADHQGRPLVLAPELDAWSDVRHHATRAVEALDPEASTVRADLAVPISVLPELVQEAAQAAGRRGLRAFVFGHAGIGILHVLVPARRGGDQWRAAEAVKAELVEVVLGLHGAVSGEHGMGLGNRRHANPALVPLMKGIKAVFDPRGILNPGKIWE